MRKIGFKEKGITLIALAVTIIVLLILAGVTLNSALSNNGLFQKAKTAAEKYKEADGKETEEIQKAENNIDSVIYDEPVKRGPNVEPEIVEEFKVIETSTTGFKLEGKVRDVDNDKLTVTVSGLKNNPKAQKITETNVEEGVTVTIDALKGQDNYTEYDWTVTVMDTARVSVTNNGKNKTYCQTHLCEGPFVEELGPCDWCDAETHMNWTCKSTDYKITGGIYDRSKHV